MAATVYGHVAAIADHGTLRIRAPERHIYQVQYAEDLGVEWRGRQLPLSSLVIGDLLEMDLERHTREAPPVLLRARLVDPAPSGGDAPKTAKLQAPPIIPYRSPTESFAPRGQLTYSGVVSDLGAAHLTLQQRKGGRITLRLRPDTRYLREGLVKQQGDLDLQTMVFVRAGRGYDGVIEAFQVVWGGILGAR